MARLPLFEFEDQPWCPRVLRNAVTGYIDVVARITRQLRPVVPAVRDLLAASGESSILDLCSGSGGAARRLGAALAAGGAGTPVVLTDLYPDTESHDGAARSAGPWLRRRDAPLDATDVPDDVPGLRTMFNAFHHFDPPAARRILASAARSGRPLAVVEFIERSPLTLLGVLFSPVLSLVLMPLVRPVRWEALFFTYVVPLVPAMIFWDGLASWLRVYSLRELDEMAAAAGRPGYAFRSGRWRIGPVRVTYLLGQKS